MSACGHVQSGKVLGPHAHACMRGNGIRSPQGGDPRRPKPGRKWLNSGSLFLASRPVTSSRSSKEGIVPTSKSDTSDYDVKFAEIMS